MRLMEQDQRIGIELEFYGDKELAREIVKGHGLDVCGDASLGGDGVEVKFDGGVPIKDAMPRINMMHKLITDGTSLKTEMVTTYDNPHLPSAIANKLNIMECDEDYSFGDVGEREGTTGIHVHFAIPEHYSFLDLIALADYMKDNDQKVRELAWRDSKVWAKNPSAHGNCVTHMINDLRKYVENREHWKDDCTDHNKLPRIELRHDKYIGMNILNVGVGKHTIEFRYADSALLADLTAFKKYLKFLTKAVQDHIIGRTEYNVVGDSCGNEGIFNYTLKEVKKEKYNNGLASYTYYDVIHKDKKLFRAYSLR